MYRMAMLSLLSEEDDELDIAKCVQMAVVHDLAEATVGDITPYDGISKAEKEKLESVSYQTGNELRIELIFRTRMPCSI
jgi:putative hydrolase of HD superfamily